MLCPAAKGRFEYIALYKVIQLKLVVCTLLQVVEKRDDHITVVPDDVNGFWMVVKPGVVCLNDPVLFLRVDRFFVPVHIRYQRIDAAVVDGLRSMKERSYNKT